MPGREGALVQADAESGEGGEIEQSGNSTQYPEAADCITCESEGRTRVPVLSAVRQDVPSGCCGLRLCQVQSQWRRGWGGRPNVRRDRSVRRGALARGTGGRTQEQDLSTAG